MLISGGDSLLNDNQVIKTYLENFSAMEHLDFIRLGTKIPVVLPQRISGDEELLDILNQYNQKKRVYVVTQFNHVNEVTPAAIKCTEALQNAGIVVKNQSVLVRGVNDTPQALSLIHISYALQIIAKPNTANQAPASKARVNSPLTPAAKAPVKATKNICQTPIVNPCLLYTSLLKKITSSLNF